MGACPHRMVSACITGVRGGEQRNRQADIVHDQSDCVAAGASTFEKVGAVSHEDVDVAHGQGDQVDVLCSAVSQGDHHAGLFGKGEPTADIHKVTDAEIQDTADLQIQRVVHTCQRRAAHRSDAVPIQLGRRRTAVGDVVQQVQFPHVQHKAAREAIHRHQTYMRRNTRPTART